MYSGLMARGADTIDGKYTLFGFFSVKDWLSSVILSFPAPWSLMPREGKYYGTKIQDARGVPILTFWMAEGGPSDREKAAFGMDWTQEAWAEYCCDCHWESESALVLAVDVIQVRNKCGTDCPDGLLSAIVEKARWCDDVFPDLLCGGPARRRLHLPLPR